MKMKILLMVCFIGFQLYAQPVYKPGAVVKGRNATYCCKDRGKFHIVVRNVLNTDTTDGVYYRNGKRIRDDDPVQLRQLYDNDDLKQVLKEELTQQEWDTLKCLQTSSLTIYVVSDHKGNPLEIAFDICTDDPVFTNMDPDRLFQLETRFKQIMKMDVWPVANYIYHLKYFGDIVYRELEKPKWWEEEGKYWKYEKK